MPWIDLFLSYLAVIDRLLCSLIQPTNCLSVFDHFVRFALKGVEFSECNNINIVSFTKLQCTYQPAHGILFEVDGSRWCCFVNIVQ